MTRRAESENVMEAPKSFAITMRDVFGGGITTTFMEEFKKLSKEDKQDFYRLLKEAGYNVANPYPEG